MSKFITIRFDAGTDTNGNPKRVYVVIEAGDIIATYKDEYGGIKTITNKYHRQAYNGLTFVTTKTEYRSLCNYLRK